MNNVDVKKECRDIDELNPLVLAQLEVALKKIKSAKINPLITETWRSEERQCYLYGKSRTAAQLVKSGLSRITADRFADPAASACTWTLNSIHIKRKAVDLIPQRIVKGRMAAIYNRKDPQTIKIIAIMCQCGFEAGANWKRSVDSPHFQVDCETPDGYYDRHHTTVFVTRAVQAALNKKLGIKLKVNGSWDAMTDQAITTFRQRQGWNDSRPILGAYAIKVLLS